MDEQRLVENLVAAMQVGADARDFCRHPIFKEVQKWLDSHVAEAHKEWLGCQDKIKREELWYKVQPYQELQDFFKRLIIHGDTAAENYKKLKAAREDNLQ